MKLIVPSLACLGLSSARMKASRDCRDLTTMEGMGNCVSALVSENKRQNKVNDQMKLEMQVMEAKLAEKQQPQTIHVSGDHVEYHGSCGAEEDSAAGVTGATPMVATEAPADPRMNGVPEFLNTPKNDPEAGPVDWTNSDYHYYMNCVDEVELRIWTDFQKRDPNWPTVGPDIPTEPYFRVDPTNFTVGDLANEGFREILEAAPHPWGWSNIDAFGASAGAHGREMMSWATDEVKDFWRTRQSWYKEEVAEVRWFLWLYIQNTNYRYCSGLPTYKRIWGSPVREDGCNPKYPYTSWVNEGFNTTAADCDNEFIHDHPKSFSDDRFVTGDNLDLFKAED